MLEDRIMSKEYRHVELMIGDVRRRRWTTERKLQIIEESYAPGETVSSTARRHGVAPNLLYRRLLSEGGAMAVDSDEPVIGTSEVKKLEDRVRDLERMLGRKTLENEILREALSKAQSKKLISRFKHSMQSALPRNLAQGVELHHGSPLGRRQPPS
jgi:transposase